MTTLTTERAVSPTTRCIIETQVALAALYGISEDNPVLDAAVREVCTALAADAGHAIDGTKAHDAFIGLLDADQRLTDLADNPDEHLASLRLPRTSEQALRCESDLRAERADWMRRILGVAR